MNYIRGQEVIVSGQVMVPTLTSGVAGETEAAYNFVTTGGYVLDSPNAVPVDDDAKGSLLFTMTDPGPNGNPVQIIVDDTPVDATNVPLNLYVTADATEPYLRYNGPVNAGTFLAQLVFRKTGSPDVFIDQWTEQWR